MKKLITTALAALALMYVTPTFAADKEVTLKGEGKCAKCALKLSDKCQDVIEVKKDGKKVVYWIEMNEVGKAFHKKVCSDTVKMTAVGKVEKKGDKMILVASKLEEEKK